MTRNEKINALVQELGMTRKEAKEMLNDMGE